MRISIDVSPGEALDRLTILTLKLARITDASKLAHIERELRSLALRVDPLLEDNEALRGFRDALLDVNAKLWDCEDEIRRQAVQNAARSDVLQVATRIPELNDKRARLKADINRLLGTDIAEQKSYAA
jgi:outer membrane murein-binding lipoprotein Lpp